MRVLPEKLRNQLSEPIGPVFNDDKKLKNFLEKQKNFVSIGDYVTYTVLKQGLKPFFCVVDYKTKRGPVSEEKKDLISSFGDITIKVDNPEGCISDPLWDTIKKCYENIDVDNSYRIEIEGEEDLASLPAIFLAPTDVTVIYGLPDRGVLVAKATQENKAKVNKVLKTM
jgi:GTP-dependent dephospho-CoA kinase